MLPYPAQPLDFADWMKSRLTLRGRTCRAVLFERDGSITVHFRSADGAALFRWGPEPEGPVRADDLRGLGGRVLHRNLSREDVERLAEQIAAMAAEELPPWFTWGPPSERQLAFSAEGGLGAFLKHWIRPGFTRWGAFVAEDFGQPRPNELTIPFVSEGEATRRRVVFVVRAPAEPSAGSPTPFGRGDLRLGVQHDDRQPAPERPMTEQVERLVGFALGRTLGLDAHLVLPAPPAPPEEGEAAAPEDDAARRLTEILLDSPLPRDLGGDFFFRTWGSNFLSNEMVLLTPGFGSMIAHGSRECLCPLVTVSGFDDHFYFLPWARHREEPGRTWVTDFDDQAAVRGGMERLGEALDQAVTTTDRGRVYILEMCDYECLSEDVTDAIFALPEAARQRISGFPNVSGPDGPLAIFDSRWTEILARYREARPEDDAPVDAVHLVGYGLPGSAALTELEALLEAADVRVSARLFPYLDPRHMDDLPAPGLWVVNPWRVIQDGPGRYLTTSGEPWREVAAPYGPRACRAWLDGVREGLGRPPLDDATFAALLDAHAPEIPVLREAARGLEISFAVPAPLLDEFGTERCFFGFRPLSFLLELGLRVTVLVTRGGRTREEARTCLAKNDPAAAAHDRLHIELAAPDAEIADALAALPGGLLYSEYAADPRALAAGKTPVNARHFEPGLAGSVRTIRRLLRLARGPFFRRYGHLLEEKGR